MFAKLAEHAVYNIPQSPPFRLSPLSLPPTEKTPKLHHHHHHHHHYNHSSVVVPQKNFLSECHPQLPEKKRNLEDEIKSRK
jgi:hypothetical protein